MKSFKIKAIGLEEMTMNDSIVVNGGGALWDVVVIAVEGIIEWIIDPEGSNEDFKKGYDKVRRKG